MSGELWWACLFTYLYVCLFAGISPEPQSKLHQIFMHVIHDNVLVLLRQRWNMLCTSGFEDDHDVKFSHKLTLWRSRQSDY